jgi:hypothetical protein
LHSGTLAVGLQCRRQRLGRYLEGYGGRAGRLTFGGSGDMKVTPDKNGTCERLERPVYLAVPKENGTDAAWLCLLGHN